MLNNNQLEIITTSIEAAVQPQLWHKALDLLIDSYQGLSGNINVMDEQHESRIVIAMSRFIREEAFEMYEKFLQREDADDSEAIGKIFDLAPNRITSEYELFNKRRYDDLPPSSFRDWQLKEFDIVHRYGLKMNSHGPWLDVLLFHTDSQKGLLRSAEITEINQVSQVMTSSLKSFRAMEQLRRQFNATLGALDRLGIACFLTTGHAQVIHKNTSAEDLLEQKDGIHINPSGALLTHDGSLNHEINLGCNKAYRTTLGEANATEVLLSISRPSGKSPYLLVINPIIDSNAELETGLRCTMVFVIDPTIPKKISVEGLVKMGSLSPAESEICRLLVEGKTTKQITDRRNVSEQTVRKQVKSVLSKLNCSSRIELLRLAIDTRLPVN